MQWKTWLMGFLLIGIALVGPIVAYAGVSAIYPASQHTITVDPTPPITIDDGDDSPKAVKAGFLSALAGTNNNASFTISVNPLAGTNITIDNYLWINRSSTQVTSWKLQIATNWNAAGGLATTEVSSAKVRAWTGSTAPVVDGSAAVCAFLDITSATANLESSGSCSATATKVQIQVILNDAASGSATVSLRPSSIEFPA